MAKKREEKLEKAKKAQEQKAKQERGTKILVFSMIAFVVLVGVVFSVMAKVSASNVAGPKGSVKADGHGIVFNATKKPVIDIWEDFQCTVCGKFEEANNAYINSVVKEGKAKVVFHTLSFIGAESVLEAQAGACAADQDKFLEMHNILYANQGEENSGIWTNESLLLAGAKIGLDSDKYSKCLTDNKYLKWVEYVALNASKYKVTGTPTVFVNGKELDRATQYLDPEAFKAALAKGGVK